MSASIDFQHSQPQSVYRPKDRLMGLLAGAMMAGAAVYWIFEFIDRPRILTIINVAIWLWWAFGFVRNALRNRIVMSPAGISIIYGRSAATPWSNIERIQVFTVGARSQVGAVPCLVLREPAQGTMKPITRGVPAELSGRVVPMFPFQWSRIAELEEELYRYLPVGRDGQLAVPPSLAAISQRHERTSQRVLAALVLIAGLVVFLMLRGIL